MDARSLLVGMAAVAAATCVLTWIVRTYALRGGLLDVPNIRSSHARPVPRGGGLAVALSMLAWMALQSMTVGPGHRDMLWLLVASAAVGTVGFVDDHGHVEYRIRLMIHALAAGLLVWAVEWNPVVRLLDWEVQLGWSGTVVAWLGVIWLINLYNFMDGIDGIAGSEAVTVLGAAGALMLADPRGPGSHVELTLVTAAAAGGFLLWNWEPARIFLGDVGSGFLGFVIAAIALFSTASGVLEVWTWLILLGCFLVDSTVTLLVRVVRGEKPHEAHRSHAYQRLSRHWGSHARVTLAVACVNVFWLGPLAMLSESRSDHGVILLLVAWAPLTWFAIWIGAGRPGEIAESAG